MTINPIRDRNVPMTPGTTQILFIELPPEIIGASKTNPPDALIPSAVAIARLRSPRAGRRVRRDKPANRRGRSPPDRVLRRQRRGGSLDADSPRTVLLT